MRLEMGSNKVAYNSRFVLTIAEYPLALACVQLEPAGPELLRPRPPLNINALHVNLVNIDIVDKVIRKDVTTTTTTAVQRPLFQDNLGKLVPER